MSRARRNRLNEEQGFTLVESIVVLFILGLLIAVALLSYNRTRHTAPRDEHRALGQDWRTLDCAYHLTQSTTRACSSDSQIGYPERGAYWKFAAATNMYAFCHRHREAARWATLMRMSPARNMTLS